MNSLKRLQCIINSLKPSNALKHIKTHHKLPEAPEEYTNLFNHGKSRITRTPVYRAQLECGACLDSKWNALVTEVPSSLEAS